MIQKNVICVALAFGDLLNISYNIMCSGLSRILFRVIIKDLTEKNVHSNKMIIGGNGNGKKSVNYAVVWKYTSFHVTTVVSYFLNKSVVLFQWVALWCLLWLHTPQREFVPVCW